MSIRESDENLEDKVQGLWEILRYFKLTPNMEDVMAKLPGHFSDKNICKTLERMQHERGVVFHTQSLDSNKGMKRYFKNIFAYEAKERISEIIEDLTEEVEFSLNLARNEVNTIPKFIKEYFRQKGEILQQFSSFCGEEIPFSDVEVESDPKNSLIILSFPCSAKKNCPICEARELCVKQEAIFAAFKWIIDEMNQKCYKVALGNTIISMKDSNQLIYTEKCGMRVKVTENIK